MASQVLQDLGKLLADGWQPIAPAGASDFGGQKDIRAVQIRLALAQEPPEPLLEAIKQLLWREWDPMGVNKSPAAQGEYDGYAFRIWVALHRKATAEQIEAYLERSSTEGMGRGVAPGLNGKLARKIVAMV